MKSVGIKQLKARLSEYVRLVKTGETVLVTERDEVVAELRPPLARARPASTADEALDALAEAGAVTRARVRKHAGWVWSAAGAGLPAGTAAALLDALRDDRTGG